MTQRTNDQPNDNWTDGTDDGDEFLDVIRTLPDRYVPDEDYHDDIPVAASTEPAQAISDKPVSGVIPSFSYNPDFKVGPLHPTMTTAVEILEEISAEPNLLLNVTQTPPQQQPVANLSAWYDAHPDAHPEVHHDDMRHASTVSSDREHDDAISTPYSGKNVFLNFIIHNARAGIMVVFCAGVAIGVGKFVFRDGMHKPTISDTYEKSHVLSPDVNVTSDVAQANIWPDVVQQEIRDDVVVEIQAVTAQNDAEHLDAESSLQSLRALNEILSHVDWKQGIHRELVAGTAILDTKSGFRTGMILDSSRIITAVDIVEKNDDLRAMRFGEAYHMQRMKDFGGSFKISYNKYRQFAVLTFDSPVFGHNAPSFPGEQFSLPLLLKPEIRLNMSLLVCGNPAGREPRYRDGGVIIEIIDEESFVLGVEGSEGYIGSPISNMEGKIVGIVSGVTRDDYTFRTPHNGEREVHAKALLVRPLGVSVDEIKKEFIFAF